MKVALEKLNLDNILVMKCSLCNSTKFFHIGKIHDYEYDLKLFGNYYFCKICKTCFKDNKKINNKKLYKSNYIPISKNYIFSFLKNLYAKFESKLILKNITILNKDKILDIACGNGYLLKNLFKYSKAKYHGIDLNMNISNNEGIKFYKQNINNFEIIKKVKPNIIIINNFIEHLEGKRQLNDFFKNIKKKTIVIILTPDFNSEGRKKFKNEWSGYHSPRHYYVFSENSFSFLKKKYKYKIKHSSKFFDPFTNIVSILNVVKSYFYGKRQFKISDLPILVFGLFSDIKRRNRLFYIIEKQ